MGGYKSGKEGKPLQGDMEAKTGRMRGTMHTKRRPKTVLRGGMNT